MNFVTKSQDANLTRDTITGLSHSSVSFIKDKVIAKQLEVDQLIPGSGKTVQGPIDALNEFERHYDSLLRIDAYPPAQAKIKSYQAQAQSSMKVDAIIVDGKSYICQTNGTAESTGLTQVRSATSTRGNSSNGGSSGTGTLNPNGQECFGCGSKTHLANSPLCPNRGKPSHGLSDDVNTACNEKAKEMLKTMPKRENIPDDAEYHIIIGGKIVAKHCRHCNRFTKGSKAHCTKEHKGTKNRCTYKPPSEESIMGTFLGRGKI